MPTIDLGSVVGPQGEQGEIGPQGAQGIQGPPGPAGENPYDYAVAGGFTGTEAEFQSMLASGPWVPENGFTPASNENLLYNWYFGPGVINQAGRTTVTTNNTEIVSKWETNTFGGSASVTENGIHFVPGTYQNIPYIWLEQIADPSKVQQLIPGDTIRLSFLLSDGNLISGYVTIPSDWLSGIVPPYPEKAAVFSIDINSANITAVTYSVFTYDGKGSLYARFSFREEITILAAKLEKGKYQTLARKNASGKWVLNDPPPSAGIETLKMYGGAMAPNAGAHNAIYRGAFLGSAVTDFQYNSIAAGTFDDLYIGDYWTIGGVNYRIAAFDYFLLTGDTATTKHHVVIVPDSNLYNHVMNESDTTAGGYVGSKMYTNGLEQAKATIKAAFPNHVLKHRVCLTNGVNVGLPSSILWRYSEVDLMNEQMAYGGAVFMPASDGTTIPANHRVEKSQLPLFTYRPDLISNRLTFWLRDVVGAFSFAYVSSGGDCNCNNASHSLGVRPYFCIARN